MGEGLKVRVGGLYSAFIPPLLAPQMAASGRCLSLLLLSTCVALLLQPPLGAQGAPMEPVYPGDNATPEQMAQYAAELRRYINMLTRPRCVRDRGTQISASGALATIPAPAPSVLLGKQRFSTDRAWAPSGMVPKRRQGAGELVPGHSAGPSCLSPQVRKKRQRRHAGLPGVGIPPCSCPQVGLIPSPACQLPGAETGVGEEAEVVVGRTGAQGWPEGTRTTHSHCHVLPSPHRELSPMDL